MPESGTNKKILDNPKKRVYKDKLDEDTDDELVTVKKKELIHALTTLEGVKRGLRKALDKHRA